MEEYTLDSGTVIKLVGISDTLQNMIVRRVEKEFRAKGEPIDPPTYTVKTAFGGEVMEETNPHTETTLEVTAADCMIDAGDDEETFELLFDDDSLSPFAIRLARGQAIILMAPPKDRTEQFVLKVWTKGLKKVVEMPAYYRTVNKLATLYY